MSRHNWFVLACAVVAALALGIVIGVRIYGSPISMPAAVTVVHCHEVDGLPDPACTPGAIDARVSQDDIGTTICVPGYTRTVRPSTAYTNDLKRKQIVEYGYADTNPADYEEDHLIPLELGGSPADTKNLWPEPANATSSASQQ